jgi:hypothetical protein
MRRAKEAKEGGRRENLLICCQIHLFFEHNAEKGKKG